MVNWLLEIITVVAHSTRTRWALILGCLFFIGINLLGIYIVSGFEPHDPAAGLTDVLKQMLAKEYNKAAWIALIFLWALAFKFYHKDKNRFY